jgi:serine/threonine protein phosphatase PrpC
VKWETSAFEVCAGDSFLLCSDGFWEPVAEKEMLSALSADNAKGWLGIMSSAAKRNGGDNMDNYTAITVMVKG